MNIVPKPTTTLTVPWSGLRRLAADKNAPTGEWFVLLFLFVNFA